MSGIRSPGRRELRALMEARHRWHVRPKNILSDRVQYDERGGQVMRVDRKPIAWIDTTEDS